MTADDLVSGTGMRAQLYRKDDVMERIVGDRHVAHRVVCPGDSEADGAVREVMERVPDDPDIADGRALSETRHVATEVDRPAHDGEAAMVPAIEDVVADLDVADVRRRFDELPLLSVPEAADLNRAPGRRGCKAQAAQREPRGGDQERAAVARRLARVDRQTRLAVVREPGH